MDSEKQAIIHICLLGDDPTANLTPLVDRNIPSEGLIIAYEKHQQKQLDRLTQIAQSRGFKVDQWLLPTTLETEKIKLNFMDLFERINNNEGSSVEVSSNEISTITSSEPSENPKQEPHREFWLNASNGSRHQVLAAYEVARSYKVPIFVVEPKQDAICWLHPESWPLTPINDKLNLDEFFLVNGFQMASQKNQQGIPKHLIELGHSWLSKAEKLNTGLSKLNYLAVIARGKKYTSHQDRAMLDDQSLQWLLDELKRHDLIELDGKAVHFLNDETRFFCNGGWLEETTFGYIRELHGELKTIQDDGHSVEVEAEINGKMVTNELDVVALVNNKLHVIECKTKKIDRGDGNNTLYKLDSLAEKLGGLKAKAALVTFFPIRDSEMRRAIELDIKIFSVAELSQLKQQLKSWLASS